MPFFPSQHRGGPATRRHRWTALAGWVIGVSWLMSVSWGRVAETRHRVVLAVFALGSVVAAMQWAVRGRKKIDD